MTKKTIYTIKLQIGDVNFKKNGIGIEIAQRPYIRERLWENAEN